MIVPNGFTGIVWLIEDSQSKEIPKVQGRYRIVIPANGVLRVKSLHPLRQWHEFSARYEDGTPIPNDYDGKLAPQAIAVRGSGSGGRHEPGHELEYSYDL